MISSTKKLSLQQSISYTGKFYNNFYQPFTFKKKSYLKVINAIVIFNFFHIFLLYFIIFKILNVLV